MRHKSNECSFTMNKFEPLKFLVEKKGKNDLFLSCHCNYDGMKIERWKLITTK